MRRAVALARRGLGRTSPNPPVGALVVKRGRLIAEGWHRRAGGPHAEVVALDRAGGRAQGATLYVTLEPCAHFGRTPPCVAAIRAAGIARVVVGIGDPNPLVRGRGLRTLRRAGVEVTTGVLRHEAGAVSAWFRHAVVARRPYVVLKLAASLDGRIATTTGESRWVSGPAARRFVHDLRDRVDAVMVGAGTVMADDPQLTCRRTGGRDPLRVVVDGRLRISPRARVLRVRSGASTLVVTTTAVPRARRAAIERAGAEVLALPGRGGRFALTGLLEALWHRGVVSVLVEGGADLAAAALREEVVDRFALILAPKLIGGDGKALLGSLGLRQLAKAPQFGGDHLVRLGPDLLWEGAVQYRR